MNFVISFVTFFESSLISLRGIRRRWNVFGCDFRPMSVAAILLTLALSQLGAAQIQVQPNTEGNTGGNSCSLQEAIYATEFGTNVALDQTEPDDTYYTGCSDASAEWNTIDLPGGTLSFTKSWDGDAHDPFGPTATPIIFSTITIRGHGTTLQWNGPELYRLFAVGYASISPTSGVLNTGTYSGTGNLTLQDVYVNGFTAKGGDGNLNSSFGGGGGGLGAGGAIYLGKISSGVPALTVVNSTFQQNGAVGGAAGTTSYLGGGAGMGGRGGYGNGAGGGGGGSRGNGGTRDDTLNNGGGGGGTVDNGGDANSSFGGSGGYLCGGNGGDDGHPDGYDAAASCPGGGGGGGGLHENGNLTVHGDGGGGSYGGGGGGAGCDSANCGSGGSGGFGGGGGASFGTECDNSGCGPGGNGGFGGGAGAGSPAGTRGEFGGEADGINSGAGGALGGAIFNDSGTLVIQNSTFYKNFVSRGGSDAGSQYNGGDSGGAIFSRNGSTTVQNVTISNNEATGAGGGIVVYKNGATTIFILDNTIIANNGAQECIVEGGTVITTGSAANLIVNNSGCPNVTVPSDPMLDTQPKPNSPGDTPTMALLPGSPAIDAGDDATALGQDQRGVQRPQGAHSDIGAYERVPQADLSLGKAVSSGTAKAGDTITYTLTVSNLGPDTANTVTVTDNFPTALTYVSCSAPGGSCGTQGAAVVTTYTSLAANSSETITITGTLNSGYSRGTVIENDASVQASSPADPDDSNNHASALFTVIVPDFTLTAASPISIDVGGSGTSSLTIGSIDTFSSAVSLTGTGPSGFQESFSPNPVTPPSNGSANSTMTVSLGPSVTAGAYTVNVTGTSGSLTHAASVTVNVQATISGTINVIGTDQALGCIDNSGISGALQNKLQAAQADINAGRIQDAINTLQALLNQLQAQDGKHIKTTCTDSNGNTFDPDAVLIADVKAILASLGVNVADPIIGNVVNGSGTGLSGLTVKILNSKNATIATATTDVTGFYYFPATNVLNSGASYTVKVTVPKGYKNSTPSSQSFTWKAVGIALNNFVLN